MEAEAFCFPFYQLVHQKSNRYDSVPATRLFVQGEQLLSLNGAARVST
jgi:hypothetical protein